MRSRQWDDCFSPQSGEGLDVKLSSSEFLSHGVGRDLE